MDYIEISTTNLESDRARVQQCIRQIEKELSDLVGEVEKLNSMWTGPANAAYNNQVVLDQEKLTELLAALADIAECMAFASEEYVKCENHVADMIAAIRL